MAYENRDYMHLSEEEKQKIELIAQAIRNKAYGIDVRESIALAIEWVNREYKLTIENNILTLKEFENAKSKVSTLELDMDEFIQRYSEQIAGNTSLDETIDARVDATGVSHTTLKDRLDKEYTEVATQLAKDKLFKKNSTFLQNVIDKMHNGEEVNIISIGDSTANSDSPDGFSSPRYHERIQSNLRSFYNRSNINVINKAVGGRPAIAAVRDIEYYDTDPIKPDLWIIMFGINDANPNYAEGQTIEDFKENMSILTERALSKGAEVLLVSPSSVWKTDFDRPKRQKNYARAVKDVASKYQVAYFDLEYNFSKLIIDDIYGIDDLVSNDFVHKNDLGYKIMADLVSQNILNTDMYVQEGVTIPVRRSPYLSTNSATIIKDSKDKYGHHLLLNKAIPNEYLKFNFMVTEPNIDLVLIAPLRSTGGVIKYTVDGIEKTLDFYSPTMAYNAEFVIAENIAIGYHEISFNSNDIVLGQTAGVYDPVVNFSAFQFRKNTKKLDALFNSDDSSFTKYKSVIGTAELSNSATSDKAVVFGEYVHEGDLTFIAKGKFVPNTGIMWNAKDNFSGYLLRFHTNLIIVTAVREDDALEDILSTFDLKQYSGTVNYTNEITFKIENKKDGTINVFMNGVLIITLVDTRHRSGRFGVFAKNASLNISDLKYSIT